MNNEWEKGFDNFLTEEYGHWKIGRAEAKSFIQSLLASERADWLRSEIERLEWEIKPETKIEDCENCGEEGYGKAWFGRGRETGDAWGDRYTPTGSVVFCKNCKPEFRIGKEWNGEEIWKTTSDDPQHDALRLSSITKTINKEWNQALTSIITRLKVELKVLTGG